MLRLPRSLALRAGTIFISIYLATLLAGLGLVHVLSTQADGSNHIGPDIAIALATAELSLKPGGPRLTSGGRLSALARRNPDLWVALLTNRGVVAVVGQVPGSVSGLLTRQGQSLQLAEFRVEGVSRPLADASIELRSVGGREVLLAAGGVRPETISLAATVRYLVTEGVFVVLISVVAAGLLAMLLAAPLVSAATRPLARAAGSIHAGDSGMRLDERIAPHELRPIARAFNAALDRLNDELTRRRRFIADLAHELRTPLAILNLRLDELPESERRVGLERVATRLNHLIGQMLDVERLSLAGRRSDRLDLGMLAQNSLADIAPLAMAEGYELSFSSPERRIQVRGDEHALGRVLGNVLANAVAHAGGTGQISVQVSEWATIDIVDEGPGIPAALRPSVFEPFARERLDRDGCGLGLHLAREIMRAHGGDLILLPTPAGAAFRMQFATA